MAATLDQKLRRPGVRRLGHRTLLGFSRQPPPYSKLGIPRASRVGAGCDVERPNARLVGSRLQPVDSSSCVCSLEKMARVAACGSIARALTSMVSGLSHNSGRGPSCEPPGSGGGLEPATGRDSIRIRFHARVFSEIFVRTSPARDRVCDL